jgi:DegV family protein with EDD domain
MIKIVTDTTAGLPVEWTRERDILVLPQFVIFGEDTFRDDTELDTATFLEKLRAAPALPKTAAPAPALYTPIYRELLAQGDEVLVLVPSGEISGTLRSAEVAAQDFKDNRIHVFDTRTVAAPFAAMVMRAWELVQGGAGVEDILAELRGMQQRQRIYFVVASLEFLRRGGRIGGAQALIGGMLQIKPILTLCDGRVEPFEQQRTQRRALSRICDLVLSQCPPGPESYLGVMHCDALDEANSLVAFFKDNLKLEHIPVYTLPPAVVVHGGPGILAVSFFTQPSA